MGDLNALLSYADRRGKGPISVSSFSCLEQFMESCELKEIGFRGNPYTWTNSRSGPANVQHRLDRALANSDWVRCYPHAQILHELKIGSDHSPLIMCSNAFPKPPRKLFCFELKWTLENGYQECIQNGWQVHITGSEQYKVMGKLKNCRADLLSWSKKLRGNPQGEIKFLREKLDFMQNQEPNDANMLHQKMLIQKLNDLWAKEEAYWFQWSRLQNDAGQLLQSEEEISTYVFRSLSFQFQACPTIADMDIVFSFPPVITSEMNNSLCIDITLEEVKAATFQLGAFKAPGPDGFPGVFYQKHWDLVGGDVHKAISRFWGQAMPPQLVVQKAMFLADEFCRVNGKDPLIPPVLQLRDGLENKLQRWSPPPKDVVKCNTDAAVDVKNGIASLAVVCRNSRVGWAARNGLKDIIFESDSKELVQAINKKVHLPWQIEPLVLSVWELCKSFSFCEFNYVCRKANSAADWVAKKCLKNLCPLYWTTNPPTMLRNLLRTDVNY
ncbi:hypothetical protein SLEP1_g34198 [Rubroshorea leprosula]|nr:hypothetical protein SLEP1_g34198 [Rubroshorea leprosula]